MDLGHLIFVSRVNARPLGHILGTKMIIRRFLVLLWAFLLAAAAVAGEEQRTKIEIEIDGDDSGHRSFRFDSKDAGFNLHDMAVGETRELTGESGNTALVTRTEDGFVLDVDGFGVSRLCSNNKVG